MVDVEKTLTTISLALIVTLGMAHYKTSRDLRALRADVIGLSARPLGLRSGMAPATEVRPTILHVDRSYSKGSAAARVVLIIFSDYECPFCAAFARETLPKIDAEFVASGKVSVVFRQFPLERIHKEAVNIAKVSVCAGRAGRFWEMHDLLFMARPVGNLNTFLSDAGQVGIEPKVLRSCIADYATEAIVKADVEEGRRLGLTGTPAFLAGIRDGAAVLVTKKLAGARPYEDFREMLEQLLRS
jgi:protein-disulfide isomerase